MSEPQMPSFNDSPQDPVEVAQQETIDEPNPVDNSELNQGEETPSETPEVPEEGQEGETPLPSPEPNQQFTEIIEGWREDRTKLDELVNKNRELEEKLSKFSQPEEDEEFEGLSEREKVDMVIAKREEEARTKEEAERAEVEGEIRFYERTDPFFSSNKAQVLKVAADFNAKNLAQAITILKSQFKAAGKAVGDANYNNNLKRNASGIGGRNAGGTPTYKPYDPKTDGVKSFGDLYRDGGFN
jgi:hypothetical protein